jgi:hypothetical protein
MKKSAGILRSLAGDIQECFEGRKSDALSFYEEKRATSSVVIINPNGHVAKVCHRRAAKASQMRSTSRRDDAWARPKDCVDFGAAGLSSVVSR